jgi:C1A family cysteine protease
MKNIFTRPSDDCYKEASDHQILKGERVRLDENEIKSAIASGYGIVFGISVFDSFMSEEIAHTGMAKMPDVKRENNLGGHCMFMPAYNDVEKDYFDVLNSWGPGWGDKGRCHLPVEYVMTFARDLWAIYLTE